jgi:hypothetical protein
VPPLQRDFAATASNLHLLAKSPRALMISTKQSYAIVFDQFQ